MTLTTLLALSVTAYVALIFVLAMVARARVETVEDYVVAGRRLPLYLAAPTLLATWFGAETLLAATDEVHRSGLTGATLDPLGVGLCLLIAGAVFARPLWREKLITMSDIFLRRYGRRAEWLSALLMVPPYFGWVAAQFMAVAGMLELFFGIPPAVGLVLICVVGVTYTLIGGMWAVTLTDALQVALLVVGLLMLGWVAMGQLGDGSVVAGLTRLRDDIPPERWSLVGGDDARALGTWLGVLAAGALGNLASQDVMQRIFSARSEQVAQQACYVAGGTYLVLGVVPVLLGLGAFLVVPEGTETEVLPLLASVVLHPAGTVLFVVALLSMVMSSIDSGILAPATVLARNVAEPLLGGRADMLRLNRWAVFVVGAASLAVAAMGENAYSLLESSYQLGMVSLLVPLAIGVLARRHSSAGATASMIAGTALWVVHQALGVERFLGVGPGVLDISIACTLVSLAAYVAASRIAGDERQRTGQARGEG